MEGWRYYIPWPVRLTQDADGCESVWVWRQYVVLRWSKGRWSRFRATAKGLRGIILYALTNPLRHRWAQCDRYPRWYDWLVG